MKLDFAPYISPQNKNKEIRIEFSKIFDDKNLEFIEVFPLQKRAYCTNVEMIIDTIVKIFNDSQEHVLLPYLSIIYKIYKTDSNYTVKELTNDCINIANNPVVKGNIFSYIKKIYVPIMDAASKVAKKVNTELQFTDAHITVLLCCTEMIRLLIPLLSLYIAEKKLTDEVLYHVYKKVIFNYQQDGDYNLLNKIYRFVYARIVSTNYSDRTIWTLLNNRSSDVSIYTKQFFREIIIGILPKVNSEQNMVNYLHVVVKKKIGFEFSKYHKVTCSPVNFNQVDSDGLTQFDKWEAGMAKRDESRIVVNQLMLNRQVFDLKKKFNVNISESKFQYYKDIMHINNLQRNLVFLFFAKYINGYDNLNALNRNQYLILVIILYDFLKNNNMQVLAEYLIGIPSQIYERKVPYTGKIYDKVINSSQYKRLLSTKFKYIEDIVVRENLVIKMITSLSISKYLKLNDYKTYKESNIAITEIELSPNVNELSSEVISFLRHI